MTKPSASGSSSNTRLRRSRCRRSTPAIRSVRWCASASPSATRRSMPRSNGSAARSSVPRDLVGLSVLGFALHHRPDQQRGGGAEEQDDEDEQPARRLGERRRALFLRFVADDEDLVLRPLRRLADQAALLHFAENENP